MSLTEPPPPASTRPLLFPIRDRTLHATRMFATTTIKDVALKISNEWGCGHVEPVSGPMSGKKSPMDLDSRPTYEGKLIFESTRQAEKALAIYKGKLQERYSSVVLSPFSDDIPMDPTLPTSLKPRVDTSDPSSPNVLPTHYSQLPDMALFWEAIRPWGSIMRLKMFIKREETTKDRASSYDEEEDSDDTEIYVDPHTCYYQWHIQAIFCYKEEAQRFADSVTSVCGWSFGIQFDDGEVVLGVVNLRNRPPMDAATLDAQWAAFFASTTANRRISTADPRLPWYRGTPRWCNTPDDAPSNT